jgi:hypothetical protein
MAQKKTGERGAGPAASNYLKISSASEAKQQ